MLKKCPKCQKYSLEDNLCFRLRMCLRAGCNFSEPLPRVKTQIEKDIDSLEKRVSTIEERLDVKNNSCNIR